MSTEPPYDNVAELRRALSSRDADVRADAYADVFEADLDPRDVLSDDPPQEQLVAAGIVAASSSQESRDDKLAKMVDLLEEIASNTAGGTSGGTS